MNSRQTVAAYGALYGPTAPALAATLPDLGGALSSQANDLFRDPTPERAENFASNLEGARRAVLKLREALRQEAGA